jgi:pilus assembly protein Flp/PilA
MTKLYLSVLNALHRDEEGQGLVEYGLILALIAVVVIGAVRLLGTATNDTMNTVAGAIGG